jgi:hypothetical protein
VAWNWNTRLRNNYEILIDYFRKVQQNRSPGMHQEKGRQKPSPVLKYSNDWSNPISGFIRLQKLDSKGMLCRYFLISFM